MKVNLRLENWICETETLRSATDRSSSSAQLQSAGVEARRKNCWMELIELEMIKLGSKQGREKNKIKHNRKCTWNIIELDIIDGV